MPDGPEWGNRAADHDAAEPPETLEQAGCACFSSLISGTLGATVLTLTSCGDKDIRVIWDKLKINRGMLSR